MLASEVVSDTGPLISLEKLPDGFSLLSRLFARVLIPGEVLEELQAGARGVDYLADHGLSSVVKIVTTTELWGRSHSDRLDPGERAAIGLALSRDCPILIEERLGRQVASEQEKCRPQRDRRFLPRRPRDDL